MTATMISLVSILIGIAGANVTGFVFKKYSLGITGNTIVGVFGSIFLIKSFGRLGFDPQSIMQFETPNTNLLLLNLVVSFIGGAIALVLFLLIHKVIKRNKIIFKV